MTLFSKFSKISQKQQNIFALVFISVMLILAIPFLFLQEEFKYGIHYYVIFSLMTAIITGLRASGLLTNIKESTSDIIGAVIFAVSPVLTTLYIAPSYPEYILPNFFIISIPYLLLFFIFRNSKICITVTAVLCMLLHIVSQTLTIIRGTPLNLSDFVAFKTAMTVASNYSYRFDQSFFYSFLCSVFLITAAFIFPLKLKNIKQSIVKKISFYFGILLLTTSLIGILLKIIPYKDLYDFNDQEGFSNRGVCYNLVLNMKDRFQKAPDGYSEAIAKQILNRYEADTNVSTPNIIVVMNESFADIRNISNISPSEEIMPFINSLNENVTKGNVVVSCFGGGTCNSEFEFLTGMTMAFLPQNSYPYLQYINSNIKTINNDLDSNIYDKIYIHPYIASNWKRSSIFPLLGFDTFYDGLSFSTQDTYNEKYLHRTDSIEYEGVELIRGFIGDGVTYDKVIEQFENKPSDKRIFQFVVTMQNHSPYIYDKDDFVSDVKSNTKYPQIDQYLSLIKISDNEIKKLINYFSSVNEETVIVFFGDHMPCLEDEINIINSSGFDYKYNETLQKFSTPFFIWTNFETETEYLDHVSLNYLSVLMKEKAGIPLTEFDRFKSELYHKYPVFSTNIIIDSEENIYFDYNTIDDKLIKEYEYLQYYYLFDNGGI